MRESAEKDFQSLKLLQHPQEPVDILLKQAQVIDVFSGETLCTNVAIAGERIVGMGDLTEGKEIVDLDRAYLIPGLIDSRFLLESAMLLPANYARLVAPHGTTTVLVDTQELVQVAGEAGVEYLRQVSQDLSVDFLFTSESGAALVDSESGALERIAAGKPLVIPEGSMVKKLDQFLGLVQEPNGEFWSFASNDRLPRDLLEEGGMDQILRLAVAWGLDPVLAVKMATLNPARNFSLPDRGAVAPGYLADLVVVDSLYNYRVQRVYKRGKLVAEKGYLTETAGSVESTESIVVDTDSTAAGSAITQKVYLPPGLKDQLVFTPPKEALRARIIEVLAGRLETRAGWARVGVLDPEYGIAKVAVINRQKGQNQVGLGFIRGFNLSVGAIASTLAHDQHPLVVVGADQEDMLFAADSLAKLGGGLVVVQGGKVLAALPLPIAGLLSTEGVAQVANKYAGVNAAAQGLGCTIYAPFQTLAYLTLSTIPALKITDQGLIQVSEEGAEPVPLWA